MSLLMRSSCPHFSLSSFSLVICLSHLSLSYSSRSHLSFSYLLLYIFFYFPPLTFGLSLSHFSVSGCAESYRRYTSRACFLRLFYYCAKFHIQLAAHRLFASRKHTQRRVEKKLDKGSLSFETLSRSFSSGLCG